MIRSRSRLVPLALALSAAASVQACRAEPVRSPDVTEAFYAVECRRIEVLSPANRSSAPEASELVHTYLVDRLRARGYEVGPSADGTMHVTIESWGDELDFHLGRSSRHVSLSARLYGRSGELLWQNDEWLDEELEEPEDEDDEPEDLLEGVLGSFADRGLGLATGSGAWDAEHLGRGCVDQLLHTLPRAGQKELWVPGEASRSPLAP